MNETDFKRLFKQSVHAERGFAASLTSNLVSGVPDLYIQMPFYTPALIEAKFLKDVPEKFNRKINYSALQENVLHECGAINPESAFGLIGFKRDKKLYAVMVSYTTKRICNRFPEYAAFSFVDRSQKTFRVSEMFRQMRCILTNPKPLQPTYETIDDFLSGPNQNATSNQETTS